MVTGIINVTNESKASLPTHFISKKIFSSKFLSRIEEKLVLSFDKSSENILTILQAKKKTIDDLLPSTFKDVPLLPFSNIYTTLKKNLATLLSLFKKVKELLPPKDKDKRDSPSSPTECVFAITPLSALCATEILAFNSYLTKSTEILKKNGLNTAAAKSFGTNTALDILCFYVKSLNDFLLKWTMEINVFLEETYSVLGMKELGDGFKARILESQCKKVTYDSVLLITIDSCIKLDKKVSCSSIFHVGKNAKVFFQLSPLNFNNCELDLIFYVDIDFIPYVTVCAPDKLDCFIKATPKNNPCIFYLVENNSENIKKYCPFKSNSRGIEESYRGLAFHSITSAQKKRLNAQNIYPNTLPFYIQNGKISLELDQIEIEFDFFPQMSIIAPILPFNISEMCSPQLPIFGTFNLQDFLPSIIVMATTLSSFVTSYMIYKILKKCFKKKSRKQKRAQRQASHILLRQIHRESRRTR